MEGDDDKADEVENDNVGTYTKQTTDMILEVAKLMILQIVFVLRERPDQRPARWIFQLIYLFIYFDLIQPISLQLLYNEFQMPISIV